MPPSSNPPAPPPDLPAAAPDIRRADPLAAADWDKRMAALPGATFFHTSAWARVLHETYGYRPVYYTGAGSGGSEKVMALMEVDSWLTGRRGVSLPFTDACEPLCSDANSFLALFQAAKEYGTERKWKYLECRGGRKWLPDAPASTSFLDHVLDLQSDEAALFRRFDDSVRRAVRKAEKSNLTVEFSQSLDGMREFHGLLCRTRKRHGVPPQPFPFFANIQRHVLEPGHGWVVLARHNGQAVAGAVYFHFGRGAIYKFGASDETFQQLRANNLVMWQAIQRYAREGFAHFDFGRSSIGNEGLRRFKLGWGTREEEIGYVRFDLHTKSFVKARDDSAGWHTRVFNRLPIPVSRVIGAVLYPHLG